MNNSLTKLRLLTTQQNNKLLALGLACLFSLMLFFLSDVVKAHQIEGEELPLAVQQAAKTILADDVSGFSVGSGVRGKNALLMHFGDNQLDTQYPIASASKFLTAATVMAVVDEGLLELDAPLSTWLPSLSKAPGLLTLRQLLSQTSGLAGASGEYYDLAQDHRISLEQSALDLSKRSLISVPGEVFAYGAPGFQLAGAAVEAATGQSWAEVFSEKIANPLGMTHTYWTHLRLDSETELPVSETHNPVLQGGAISTASDYLRFLQMLAQEGLYMDERILSRKSVHELLKNQTAKAFMTPAPENPIQGAQYSLGNWCESPNSQNECQRNSSIGAFGTYPWVEQETGHYGIVFIYQREDAFRLWPQIEAIRDALTIQYSH